MGEAAALADRIISEMGGFVAAKQRDRTMSNRRLVVLAAAGIVLATASSWGGLAIDLWDALL